MSLNTVIRVKYDHGETGKMGTVGRWGKEDEGGENVSIWERVRKIGKWED